MLPSPELEKRTLFLPPQFFSLSFLIFSRLRIKKPPFASLSSHLFSPKQRTPDWKHNVKNTIGIQRPRHPANARFRKTQFQPKSNRPSPYPKEIPWNRMRKEIRFYRSLSKAVDRMPHNILSNDAYKQIEISNIFNPKQTPVHQGVWCPILHPCLPSLLVGFLEHLGSKLQMLYGHLLTRTDHHWRHSRSLVAMAMEWLIAVCSTQGWWQRWVGCQ